jgi:hypothetical protein
MGCNNHRRSSAPKNLDAAAPGVVVCASRLRRCHTPAHVWVDCPQAGKVIHGGIWLFSDAASDVCGQLRREPILHDVAKKEAKSECAHDKWWWIRRQSRVRRHDSDEAESTREIGSAVYVGGDSAFLKDNVPCKRASGKWFVQYDGSFLRNQTEPCSSSRCNRTVQIIRAQV